MITAPLPGKVFLSLIEKTVTASGISLQGSKKVDAVQEAVVTAADPDDVEMELPVGTRVLLATHATSAFRNGEEKILTVDRDSILAVIEE